MSESNHKANWDLPPFDDTPEWWEMHDRWRRDFKTCATCGSSKTEVRNFDEIWRDGDLYCENGHYVRLYDAG